MKRNQTILFRRFVTGIILICFFCRPEISFADGSETGTIYTDKILIKIYESCGYTLRARPKTKITKNSTQAAVFQPSANTIFIDSKLINICRTFGPDSSHALAFILAHELSHAIYKDRSRGLVPINFLNISKDFKKNEKEEKIADIQGAFMAYLAGYDPSKVLNSLIEKIYRAYDLTDSPDDNYPSLNERKQTASLVLDQVENLISVYELSNILTAKAESEIASAGYEYILQFYRGPEILNNYGVNYVIQALNYFNESTDLYYYPVELDLNSALKKIKKPRGPLPLDDLLRREHLIEQAEKAFSEAIKMNPSKISYRINLMCCMLLKDQPVRCFEYLKRTGLQKHLSSARSSESLRLNMLMGIAHSLNKKSPQNKFFDRIILSKNKFLKAMAIYNKNISLGLKSTESKTVSCKFFLPDEADLKLPASGRLQIPKKITLSNVGLQCSFEKYDGSFRCLISGETGDIVSINKMDKTMIKEEIKFKTESLCLEDPSVSIVFSGKRQYVCSEKSDYMYVMNDSGILMEIIRFKYF